MRGESKELRLVQETFHITRPSVSGKIQTDGKVGIFSLPKTVEDVVYFLFVSLVGLGLY